MNCNNGAASSSIPYEEARNRGLTSFESHYIVNFAPINASSVKYAESSSTNCPGNNVVTHSVRKLCGQIVPVHVQMERKTDSTAAAASIGNSSDLRDSSSGSSLSLSAFHADYECSDSSGQENEDSTKSVYGSSTTFRSNPSPLDPNIYSKPGLVEQSSSDSGSPTQLTPTCLHKSIKGEAKESSSDSDDTKHSCSDGSTGCGSNLSMQVNVSHRSAVQPYRPNCLSRHHGARTLSNSKCLPKHSSKRSGESSKEISRTSSAIAKMTAVWPPGRLPKSSPCPCCSGRIVWESYSQNARTASRHSGSRSPEKMPSSARHSRHRGRSVMREGSRGHLRMAVQSLAALRHGQGKITILLFFFLWLNWFWVRYLSYRYKQSF